MVATTVYTGLSIQQPVKSRVDSAISTARDTLKVVHLPKPYATKSADRHSRVIGWPANKAPVAPPGVYRYQVCGETAQPPLAVCRSERGYICFGSQQGTWLCE